MSSTARIEALSPLLELLMETGDPSLRDRLFLDAVLGTGAARAVALWREVLAPMSTRSNESSCTDVHAALASRWSRVIARGPEDRLPSPLQFEALVEGRVAADLFGDVRVFRFGAHGSRTAIALGATSPIENALDAAEALLAAYAIVVGSIDALDAFAAPMPSPREASRAEQAQDSADALRIRHDLRNVLTSILSTRELLVRFGQGLTAEEAHHFEAVVDRECGRIGDILGRTARGAGETGCVGRLRSSAASVVRDVLDAERAESARCSIEITARVSEDAERATCDLDDTDLARIVRNLLVNAREALSTQRGTRIEVALSCIGDATNRALQLRVEDDGPGISPRQLESIFEAGVSASDAQGRGQGLAIVRELALRARGSAHASNRPVGGASFEVVLGLDVSASDVGA